MQHLIAPVVFAALTVAMFHEVLFQATRLVSSEDTDLTLQFVPWRAFGFSQLRHGHLPLWNPYVYGGTPYFAGFQSALLYPLNWLHLVLPLYVAINWIVALHVFLAGYFTYLWARSRGADLAGSILAGTMFMFGGTYFLHVYAGHLPHLCLMVWLPLLFLTIEKLSQTGSLRWCWLGVIVMAMIILAGHPQYVYYTGIISVCYVALLLFGCTSKPKLISGYVIVILGACALTAVQLLSGMQAAGESVRSGGTSYEFASMFALPPENLLTFLVPNFFGTLATTSDLQPAVPYFGRCYLWEMSLFISVSGLVLGGFAMIVDWRKHWQMIVIIGIALTLALGKHLPLYRFLFNYLPMYGSFRDVAKFTVFISLFLSALAADGYTLLLARRNQRWWSAFPIAVVALVGITFIWAYFIEANSSTWHDLLTMIRDSQESYFPLGRYSDSQFATAASSAAAHGTCIAGGLLLLIAAMITTTRFWKPAALGLVVLGVLESFVAAHQYQTTCTGQIKIPDAWMHPITQLLGDDRVLNGALPGGGEIQFLNQGLALGFRDVWGYDPGVLKRYAELLASSQHIDPSQASQYLSIASAQRSLLRMLRCRLVLFVQNGQPRSVQITDPLPRAMMIPNWTLAPSRDDALAYINSPAFDPSHSVLLELPPSILPAASGIQSPAEVTEIDTDTLEINAQTAAPALLLLTENFSTGWRATSLDSSSKQTDYDVLPADHALMAIPLDSGTHHIRLHYRPFAFELGSAISIVSLLAYLGFGGWAGATFASRHRLKLRVLSAEND